MKSSLRLKLAAASMLVVPIIGIASLAAHADTVPTVGTTDIANVGSPILNAVITNSEYVLETFGPPLFVLLLAFAVFFAIYHRVKVGHWL